MSQSPRRSSPVRPPVESPRGKLQRLAFASCTPVNATIEVTLRCNLRCVHCYNFDRSVPYPEQREAAELTPPEILSAIDQLADAGALFLAFTGGEAMLHPNILDFVRHGVKRRCQVTMKTNGVHLVERTAELVEAGATRVDVSLYGATAATHDGFTRAPGSFERTVAGARAAKAAGMQVTVNLCVTKHNAAEIGAMVDLVKDLGVGCGIDPQITARYDGTTSSLDLRIDRETLAALYRGPLAPYVTIPECSRDAAPQCSCARSVVAIASNGDVLPCVGAPIPSGNLRDRSFAEIWRDSPQLQRIRDLGLADFATCEPCPDRPFCRRSSGVVYVNTGNYTGPEDWTCMEASVLHELSVSSKARSG